jgi:ATP synthase protein I
VLALWCRRFYRSAVESGTYFSGVCVDIMTDDSGNPRPLDEFDARLRAARGERPNETGPELRNAGIGPGMGMGVRVVVELVAGIAVGTGIGYGLDRWLGTKPWCLLVFFFLGAAASVLNIYRAVHGLDDSVGLGQAQRRKHK